jgi:hypothetical protein
MCGRCDNKAVAKRWTVWAGIILTLGIFISSQIFMYGKVIGVIETHVENDPTHKELTEEFVSKDEFQTVKEMIMFLYKKEGGK